MPAAAGNSDPKEWKGGHGNASNGDNYNSGNGGGNGGNTPPPGRTDRVKHAGGQMVIDSSLHFGSLEFTGGSIAGSGTTLLTLTDATSDWTGGEFTSNAILNTPGLTIGAGSTKKISNGAKLNLSGSTVWSGDDIVTGSDAQINNAGTFVAAATGKIGHDPSLGGNRATFKNDGTFAKGAAPGTTVIEAIFNNHGTTDVAGGALRLSGGGRNADHASIIIAATAALEIDGDLELADNSSLSGHGVGRLLSGMLTANGPIAVDRFEFHGGSLAGSNAFSGTIEWTAGNWNSAKAGVITTITASGVLNFRGASNHDYSGRSIINDGIINWHAGHLRGGNGSSFTNDAIFNDLNGGNKSITSSGGGASFTNNGEYRKSQGGVTSVDVPFTNNGTLKISSGSLVFNSTFTNQGTFNLTNGAQAQFTTAVSFGSAPLTGVGTITAPAVTAGGMVAPGVSPGALTITGNLTLLVTSTLLIELGGAVQGSGYDFLSVGGTGLLAGSLDISFLNGFQWHLPADATFTILTANAGLTGAFANAFNGARLSTSDGAATFQVNYGLGNGLLSNSVVLSNFIVAVPEPSTYALLGLGGLIIILSVRRRKK